MKLKKLIPCLLAFAALPTFAAAVNAVPMKIGPVSYYGAIHTSGGKLIGAKNKAAAEALKKAFDKINSGEPAVVLDKSLLLEQDNQSKDDPWSFLERTNVKNDYLTTDMLMDRSTILSAFDAEIGIRSVPYQKKERLVTAEAESREQDSTARLMVWKATLDSSLELVNKMFGTDIRAEITYEGGQDNAPKQDNDNRSGNISKS